MMKRSLIGLMFLVFSVGCAQQQAVRKDEAMPEIVPDIAARRAKFVDMPLGVDLSTLDAGDRKALDALIEAADEIDEIYALQVWRKNLEFLRKIEGMAGLEWTPVNEYYRIMAGPWDRLDQMKPFVGTMPHPEGGGFYPEDMSREEFNAWIQAHPGEKEEFTSLTSIILRTPTGLKAVPYHEAYAEQLDRAAEALRRAAESTSNGSLKNFLLSRATAFKTDDYFQSDMNWMDLDSPLEVVIGPYETYEDGIFGYKAAFEAFLCVANPEDSKALEIYKSQLPFLEANLPIPDEYKNFHRGSESPIRVVDEVYNAGEAHSGVQTLAFNLPNDERVREAKGSKKVLLKNMMHAKYDAILRPIAAHAMPPEDAARLEFEPYYLFILHHEMSHGLGPGHIVVDGQPTEVRLELKELYSAIEEAKADSLGVYDLYALADRGLVSQSVIDKLPWTYTAGLFRTARFGTYEAHGLGVVIQTNYLLEAGALEITSEGLFRPVAESFPEAFQGLAHELLMPQALGSHEMAEDLVRKYGTVRPEMQAILDSLGDIPVDINPIFNRNKDTVS